MMSLGKVSFGAGQCTHGTEPKDATALAANVVRAEQLQSMRSSDWNIKVGRSGGMVIGNASSSTRVSAIAFRLLHAGREVVLFVLLSVMNAFPPGAMS